MPKAICDQARGMESRGPHEGHLWGLGTNPSEVSVGELTPGSFAISGILETVFPQFFQFAL